MKSLCHPLLYLLLPLVCAAAPGLGRAPLTQDGSDEVDIFAESAPRATHSLDELAWLEGRWEGKGLGGDVEEHWSHPTAGSMMGMFRLIQNGKPGFFEFCLIEETEGLVTLRFQHFNPGYTAWEKSGPLVLDLTETTPGRAVFESRDPKQSPARMVYSKRDDRNLGVLIESPQALGGPISFEVLYQLAD